MSLLFDAFAVVGGIVVGRIIAKAARSRRSAQSGVLTPPFEGAESLRASDSSRTSPHRSTSPSHPFAPFPCQLGDVLIRRIERDEAWLAGALVFSEDTPRAALFVAPEAKQDLGLFVRDDGSDVLWLSDQPKDVTMPASSPPTTLEVGGVRFERIRRLPMRVLAFGTGAPSVGDAAVVAEYAGSGAARVVVIAGSQATLTWRGIALDAGDYDVLPGGAGTFDPPL